MGNQDICDIKPGCDETIWSTDTPSPEQTKPGDGVSVDQIVSAQPGLIPQMSGFLTNQRLWGATTFFDHVSDYVYVHLMRDLSLTKTLLAKSAMDKVMAQARRTVKH